LPHRHAVFASCLIVFAAFVDFHMRPFFQPTRVLFKAAKAAAFNDILFGVALPLTRAP
jgi:hypothetical protein